MDERRAAVAVWQEARNLAEQMEEITEQLRGEVAEGKVEEFPSLLERRQKVCDRLDQLRSEWGITSWTTAGVNAHPTVKSASREMGEILRRVAREDEKIRMVLKERMAAVKGELERIRQLWRAQRAYVAKGRPSSGAFIDNKR